jgi:hypothetical protein
VRRFVAAAVLLAVRIASADDPPPIPVTKVELAERPEIAKVGKVAIYKGEADDKGVAFYIDGLGINTPVAIMLVSGESASPMKLSLKNDLSMEWDQHIQADKGISKAQFRTEGPATALVQSPTADRKPYSMVIWVGPELKLHTASAGPFVSQAEYDKQHPGGQTGNTAAGGGSGANIAIATGGILAVVVLVVVVMKRRKQGGAR